MTNITKGSFGINLGFITLSGELAEEDRQCAWELYIEISTRLSLIGKQSDSACTNFNGEIFIESFNSLYSFVKETRIILRKFPVGRILESEKQHLGIITNIVLNEALRPFLEKWQSHYRHWWENESNPNLFPAERQNSFPEIDELLSDWTDIRLLFREFQREITQAYKLSPVGS